ncbi:uncharacterized protein CIMG_12007 [Coccidioides immitis RS]|uniref:Uncharacterized protein n=1 Tax=Coccidioides immitis (strain RS) TaxID=246410 RepID=A0A0D8JVE1_COCIM|nr:uncharacterized protein CIMG_12007 [Coccidioides immitis RS]KJF60906.1 hypothetical protein CIMG_12007 [Coccidioides immitis RS]
MDIYHIRSGLVAYVRQPVVGIGLYADRHDMRSRSGEGQSKLTSSRARLISNSSSCLYHFRNRSLKLRHREKTNFSLSDEGPDSPSLSQLHSAVTRGRECDLWRVECYLQGRGMDLMYIPALFKWLETNEAGADEYVPRS